MLTELNLRDFTFFEIMISIITLEIITGLLLISNFPPHEGSEFLPHWSYQKHSSSDTVARTILEEISPG